MNSALWRSEQIQTRARIQASQARFWMRSVFSMWIISAALVFGFSCCTKEKEKTAFMWVYSSVTPMKHVTWKGDRYKARELGRWLSVTVYGGTPGAWAVWALMMGLGPVVVIGGAGLWYINRREDRETHVRGAEVLPVVDLQKRLNKAGEPGLTIATVQIPEDLHRTHFLVCGATGAGKSVTIRQMLRQIEVRGEAAIVFDPEREFVREFYNPARGDHLLNPLDARFPGWTPWAECENQSDIEAQAASLFPVTKETSDTARYYRERGRILYGYLLESLSHQCGDARLIPQEITEQMQQAKGAALAELSTVQLATNCFKYLPLGRHGWSAKEWVRNKQGWVFLTCRETEKDALLPLISLWLDSLTRRLLDSELAPQQTTWVVIDELAALRALPSLPDLLPRGRKRGVACVLGFQDVGQLIALYGKELTMTMLDSPTTRLLLRTNSAETQRWCSGDIGRREVIRTIESETAGPENIRDGISRSHQRQEEPAVMGSEFGGFPNLTGILKVAHYGAARVQVPYSPMIENQPGFVTMGTSEEPRTEAHSDRVVSKERRRV